MNTDVLRLILVTDPHLWRGRDPVSVVRAAVAGGVTLVQLRDKHAPDSDVGALGSALLPYLRAQGVPLVINDRVHLAARLGADGAHVGQGDMHPREVRKILGDRSIVGLSIEAVEQADAADLDLVDYFGVSPVFPTPTKPDVGPALGLEGVRMLRRYGVPLVGIGGIDATNAGEVARAGACGIAVVSAILGAADPAEAARSLRRALTHPPR